MSSTHKVPQKQPKPQPTSPWTEVFQRMAMQSSERAQGERAHGSRTAEADAARPTQDALSVIFNPD